MAVGEEEVNPRDLRYVKRVAAEVAGVGVSRVRLDPGKLVEIGEAVTREDVRKMISLGFIRITPKRGVSRARVRRGRRRGPGRRKGGKYSRLSRKRRWINKIRALRRELKKLRDSGKISRADYRKIYRRLGMYSSVSHLRSSVVRGR